MYRDWFGIQDVGKNSMVRLTLKKQAGTRKPMGMKRRIWDLGGFLEKIKEEGRTPGIGLLKWDKLVGRTGVLIMIFTCCRIRDMFGIIPDRSIWESTDGSIMLAMETKDGGGRLKFRTILPTKDPTIDPVATIREYWSRVCERKWSGASFFYQEDGTTITTKELLSTKFLTPYIRGAGIPPPHTPYSIKTAVITNLFNKGLSKEQISSFTGHSSNANTPLKHYFDATNNWLGYALEQSQVTEPTLNVPEGMDVSEDEEEHEEQN
jgi:hypothetical protein